MPHLTNVSFIGQPCLRLGQECSVLPRAEKENITLDHQDFTRGTGAMLPSVDKDSPFMITEPRKAL